MARAEAGDFPAGRCARSGACGRTSELPLRAGGASRRTGVMSGGTSTRQGRHARPVLEGLEDRRLLSQAAATTTAQAALEHHGAGVALSSVLPWPTASYGGIHTTPGPMSCCGSTVPATSRGTQYDPATDALDIRFAETNENSGLIGTGVRRQWPGQPPQPDPREPAGRQRQRRRQHPDPRGQPQELQPRRGAAGSTYGRRPDAPARTRSRRTPRSASARSPRRCSTRPAPRRGRHGQRQRRDAGLRGRPVRRRTP